MLGSQYPHVSSGPTDVTTPPLAPFMPSTVMPLEPPTSLEVTHGVLNHQTPVSSNPILYQSVSQHNALVGVQNFTNHTQCVQ